MCCYEILRKAPLPMSDLPVAATASPLLCRLALLLLCGLAAPAYAAAPVVVAPVERGDIVAEAAFTGSVTSPSAAMLSTATSGLAQAVLVDAGSTVAKGQLLLALDDELARLRVSSAAASLAQAEYRLQDARRRLREIEALRRDNSVAESTVLTQRSDVQSQVELVRKLQADTATQRALLQRHQLLAPFDGVVSRRLVQPGEWVIPGAPVFELVATRALRIEIAVSEEYIGKIVPGTRASIQRTNRAGEPIEAIVDTFVAVADGKSRTFPVRLKLPEDSGLVPGMSVAATLRLPAGRQGLLVPRDAVLRYPDGRVVVWTLKQSDSGTAVTENLVQLGTVFQGRVEVLNGLRYGDRVVVKGNESLQDGQAVLLVSPR